MTKAEEYLNKAKENTQRENNTKTLPIDVLKVVGNISLNTG